MSGTAQLTSAGLCCAGELASISMGGGLVAGIPEIAPGAEVRIHLMLPKLWVPVTANARVLYNLGPRGQQPGAVGFAFLELREEALRRIESFVLRSRGLYVELLHRLAEEPLDPDAIRTICLETGFPPGATHDELYKRVEDALIVLDDWEL